MTDIFSAPTSQRPEHGEWHWTGWQWAPGPASSHVVATSDSSTLSIVAMVLGVIAAIVAPIIFGPAGLLIAQRAERRGEPLARRATIVAAAGTVIGMVVAIVALTTLR